MGVNGNQNQIKAQKREALGDRLRKRFLLRKAGNRTSQDIPDELIDIPLPATFAIGHATGVEGDSFPDGIDRRFVLWRDERNSLVSGHDGLLESFDIGEGDRMRVQIERGSLLGLLAEARGDGECFLGGAKILVGMTGENPGKVIGCLGRSGTRARALR